MYSYGGNFSIISNYETIKENKLELISGGTVEDVSDNLKSLRISRGRTQKEIANSVNLDISTISAYERGKIIPSLAAVSDLADYFNVSVDSILGRNIF